MKRLIMFLAVTALGIGVSGLAVLAFRDVFFPKPVEKELKQAKQMLREVFEKNKELNIEIDEMTKKHADFLKEMTEKEKELTEIKDKVKQQVAYVKTLTKQGERLEKEVSKLPIKREYEPVRKKEPEAMSHPPSGTTLRSRLEPEAAGPLAAPSPDAEKKMEEALEQVEAEGSAETEFEEAPAVEVPVPAAPVKKEPVKSIEKDYESTKKIEPSVMFHPPLSGAFGKPETKPLLVGEKLEEEPAKQGEVNEGFLTEEEKALLEEIKKELNAEAKPETKVVVKFEPKPEPLVEREGGITPEKAKVYEAEFASFQQQIQDLKEERAKAEKAWKAKVEALEEKNAVEPQVEEEVEVEIEVKPKKVKDLQKRSDKLAKKVSKMKNESTRDRADYLYNLGVAYTSAGMYMQAAEMYEKALKIAPEDAGAHYNLGILYDEHLNRLEDGIKHYKAFLRLSKDPQKRRMVKTWIRLSGYDIHNRRESYFDSVTEAARRLLVTTPD